MNDISVLVQMDRINGLDQFTELPVSLVLFALICVDVIERIRPCKLLGPRKSAGVVSVVEYKSGKGRCEVGRVDLY